MQNCYPCLPSFFQTTVEPRFNEPLFNEVLDITNDILCPGQSYSKMYGIEPRYNEPRYNEFLDITNIIRKPKRKIYLDITNYNVKRSTVNKSFRPIPNVVLLPCRTQMNLTRQWHDYTMTVVSNVEFNSVAPNAK